MDYYSPKKAWESHYESRFHKTPQTMKKLPLVSTLPNGKWVKPRPPEEEGPKARREYRQAIRDWLQTQKIKHQVCLVSIDNKECEVFLFKKVKDVMLFKLAWG